MAESFITVLNGVITGKHHGDINAGLYGTPYYGHERMAVPLEAPIMPLEQVAFYTSGWERKSDCLLIEEGLIPMPEGYVREGDTLRPMTPGERVLAGLDAPQAGYKVEGGAIAPMSMEERLEAGQITQGEYERHLAMENESGLRSRLSELQTPEALAQAEVDGAYAAWRKARLAALLAVKAQPGWPVAVEWPDE